MRPGRGGAAAILDEPPLTLPVSISETLAEDRTDRSRALVLLARQPLRAADAGQLGAALLVREQLAQPLTFVRLDQRLSLAAERESLRVLP